MEKEEKPKNTYSKKHYFSRNDRVREKKEFDSKLLDLSRVERMTSGGRRLRFRAIMVLGNRKGKVGLGVAKGLDVAQAVEKATRLAKKNMVEIPIIEGTIPFEVEARFGAARILLRPQRKGRGLVAGGTVRVLCSLVGIEDISSKVLSKSRNKLNNAKAMILALKKLKKVKKKKTGEKEVKEVKEEVKKGKIEEEKEVKENKVKEGKKKEDKEKKE